MTIKDVEGSQFTKEVSGLDLLVFLMDRFNHTLEKAVQSMVDHGHKESFITEVSIIRDQEKQENVKEFLNEVLDLFKTTEKSKWNLKTGLSIETIFINQLKSIGTWKIMCL